MGKKTIDKEKAMFYFFQGLIERPGLCQGCEKLKTFLDKHKYADSYQYSIIYFWKYADKRHLKPLFRIGKHEMPCMSFNIDCLLHLKKIANDLDISVKIYDELKSKIDSNPENNIDQLKSCLGGSAKLRKQTWDAFLKLRRLLSRSDLCVRLATKWKEISKVFELPPCPFEKAKFPFNLNDTNDIYEPFRTSLVKYNSYSKMMISMLQEYLQLLRLGQKSTLILDQYGYRPEKLSNNLNWKSLESYNFQPIDLSCQLEVRLFLWPQNMQDKERIQLKNKIFSALFEISDLSEFISEDTPPRIRSMLSGNYLTIYNSDATHTDEFPYFLKAYTVINLFCVEEKLLTQKILYENDGKNDLKINLKNDKSCLLVIHDDTKKSKKWLKKWKEQKKLKHYIELTKTDGENLFSRIANFVESEKSNKDSLEPSKEDNIPWLDYFFEEERYKSLPYITILLKMAIHVYLGVGTKGQDDLESETDIYKLLINPVNNAIYEKATKYLKDILSFKPVVEVLIRRSLKKIKFEDIPKHFLQPTIARTGNRLATSWFVAKDGHNTRNAAVLMALGKAVIDFIQKGTITEETHIAKEIRNIDDRLRRLEDKILQTNSSEGEKSGRKHRQNISYEDRRKIPNEELREALLVET